VRVFSGDTEGAVKFSPLFLAECGTLLPRRPPGTRQRRHFSNPPYSARAYGGRPRSDPRGRCGLHLRVLSLSDGFRVRTQHFMLGVRDRPEPSQHKVLGQPWVCSLTEELTPPAQFPGLPYGVPGGTRPVLSVCPPEPPHITANPTQFHPFTRLTATASGVRSAQIKPQAATESRHHLQGKG